MGILNRKIFLLIVFIVSTILNLANPKFGYVKGEFLFLFHPQMIYFNYSYGMIVPPKNKRKVLKMDKKLEKIFANYRKLLDKMKLTQEAYNMAKILKVMKIKDNLNAEGYLDFSKKVLVKISEDIRKALEELKKEKKLDAVFVMWQPDYTLISMFRDLSFLADTPDESIINDILSAKVKPIPLMQLLSARGKVVSFFEILGIEIPRCIGCKDYTKEALKILWSKYIKNPDKVIEHLYFVYKLYLMGKLD